MRNITFTLILSIGLFTSASSSFACQSKKSNEESARLSLSASEKEHSASKLNRLRKTGNVKMLQDRSAAKK